MQLSAGKANNISDGMEKVICVPTAKVPIVKIWDPELRLACDMNVNSSEALENTRMIKTYVQIDSRVRPLAMIIKHWTKKRILNDAGRQILRPHTHKRF
jgi:DNA polymerase sigma